MIQFDVELPDLLPFPDAFHGFIEYRVQRIWLQNKFGPVRPYDEALPERFHGVQERNGYIYLIFFDVGRYFRNIHQEGLARRILHGVGYPVALEHYARYIAAPDGDPPEPAPFKLFHLFKELGALLLFPVLVVVILLAEFGPYAHRPYILGI